MKRAYRHWAWLFAAFITIVCVLATFLTSVNFGNLRWFNAVLLTVTWCAWMSDYMESRDLFYRRQRRLRLAFAAFLASGMYGSLNAAVEPYGDPTLRVALVSITGGALLTSILFHPDDDYQIPSEVEFPWERWVRERLARRR